MRGSVGAWERGSVGAWEERGSEGARAAREHGRLEEGSEGVSQGGREQGTKGEWKVTVGERKGTKKGARECGGRGNEGTRRVEDGE